MSSSGRTFVAKYHGICNECLDDIDPGDEAGYLDDEVCCVDCWEKYKDD